MTGTNETIISLQERERNRDWLTALIPVLLIGFVYYGWWVPALALTGTGAYLAVAALTDGWHLLERRWEPAVVTGLLVTFCLPATAPLWVVALACAVAALFTAGVDWAVKRWSLATAPMCPALAGYLLVRLMFPAATTGFLMPVQFVPLDGVSGATPLAALWDGSARETTTRLLTGAHSSAIGEGSVLVLVLVAGYLLLRHRLRVIAPGAMLATASLLSWLVWDAPLYGVLSGGLVLASLVLADRVYAPVSYLGQALIGVLSGGVVVLMRAVTGTDGSAVAVLAGCAFGVVYSLLAGLVSSKSEAKAENFAKTENKC